MLNQVQHDILPFFLGFSELSKDGVSMKTKVPFFELTSQFCSIEEEIKAALDEVFKTQQFILGPKVEALEKTIANYCRTQYAIGVASGSDAIFLSLMTLGIGSGDEVILPPFTFFATAGSVSRTGATPVFVDIDPNTYNIDPSKIEEKITPRTKAMIPVHLFGQCADMDPLLKIARAKKLFVVEDAAQALGAEYKPYPNSDGQKAGQIGDIGCFSFYPTKNLGAFGDAGMVVTNNPHWAEKIRLLRVHGSKPKYFHRWIGINSRLDAIQAAILLVKFKHLERWTEERRKRAKRYQSLFQDLLSSIDGLQLPTIQYENRHIFHQYVVRVPERDRLRQFLTEEEIETDIYYPLPLHLQDCYAFLNHQKGDFQNSEKASEETLALPIFPELTEEQQTIVVEQIKAFYKSHG
jgi:dTDP-4-amino-4,6-dideoxygalactose transaminase